MYSIRTLRRKAAAAGYDLHYGWKRFSSGQIWRDPFNGDYKERGFSLIDIRINGYVLGTDNYGNINTGTQAEVEEFLRDVYKANGMTF